MLKECFGVWETFVFFYFIVITYNVYDLGCTWRGLVYDVDVYTVQDPKFWGPVTMLVPNNCTFLLSKFGPGTSTKMWELPTTFDGQPPNEVQTNLLGHPILPAQDVLNFVAVHKCGHTIDAPDVTTMQYYFAAMTTASSEFNIGDLHTSRFRLFALFALGTLMSQVATSNSALQTLNLLTMRKKIERQYGQAGLAMFQARMGVDLPGPCISIAWSLLHKLMSFLNQLNLISLFITFWFGDHYIMNYFPGKAYVLLFLFIFVLGCCLPVAAQCADNPLGGCILCGLASCSLVMTIVVLFPLSTGFGLYNLKFLYVLWSGTYTQQIDHAMQERLAFLFSAIIFINGLDWVMTSLVFCGGNDFPEAREPQDFGADMTGYLNLEAPPDAETARSLSNQ